MSDQVIKITREEYEDMVKKGYFKPITEDSTQSIKPAKVSPKELFKNLELDEHRTNQAPQPAPKQESILPQANHQQKQTQTAQKEQQSKEEGWKKFYRPIEDTYDITKLTLRPAPVINKRYKKEVSKLYTLVKKIDDPEYASMATEVLESNGNLADITRAIKVFLKKDKIKKYNFNQKQNAMKKWDSIVTANEKAKNNLSNSIALTRDRSKVKQKIAGIVDSFKTNADAIDYLTDNYNSKYVGWLDSALHSVARPINAADEKMEVYQQMYKAILPDFKELKNMGANFTESEQKMLREAMPQIDTGDDLFLPNLLGFTVRLRNGVKNKVEALKEAGYKTGELDNVVGRYNKIIEKLKNKVDPEIAKTFIQEDNKNISTPQAPSQPEGFKSALKQKEPQQPTQHNNTATTQSQKIIIKPGDTAALDAILGEL